jgi:hypothetical protein
MSTATPTSSSAPTPAFGKFALVFSIAYVVTYVVCVFMSWPLFTYFPATGHFGWGRQPTVTGGGPAMYWYGWTAYCLIVSTILGLLATLLPDNVTKRIPMALAWVLPALALPLLIYTLLPLLTHK